jgi:hypothetical protein
MKTEGARPTKMSRYLTIIPSRTPTEGPNFNFTFVYQTGDPHQRSLAGSGSSCYRMQMSIRQHIMRELWRSEGTVAYIRNVSTDRSEKLVSCLGRPTSGEESVRGWMDLTVSLDVLQKINVFCRYRESNHDFSVVRPIA